MLDQKMSSKVRMVRIKDNEVVFFELFILSNPQAVNPPLLCHFACLPWQKGRACPPWWKKSKTLNLSPEAPKWAKYEYLVRYTTAHRRGGAPGKVLNHFFGFPKPPCTATRGY